MVNIGIESVSALSFFFKGHDFYLLQTGHAGKNHVNTYFSFLVLFPMLAVSVLSLNYVHTGKLLHAGGFFFREYDKRTSRKMRHATVYTCIHAVNLQSKCGTLKQCNISSLFQWYGVAEVRGGGWGVGSRTEGFPSTIPRWMTPHRESHEKFKWRLNTSISALDG